MCPHLGHYSGVLSPLSVLLKTIEIKALTNALLSSSIVHISDIAVTPVRLTIDDAVLVVPALGKLTWVWDHCTF